MCNLFRSSFLGGQREQSVGFREREKSDHSQLVRVGRALRRQSPIHRQSGQQAELHDLIHPFELVGV